MYPLWNWLETHKKVLLLFAYYQLDNLSFDYRKKISLKQFFLLLCRFDICKRTLNMNKKLLSILETDCSTQTKMCDQRAGKFTRVHQSWRLYQMNFEFCFNTFTIKVNKNVLVT